MKKKILKSALVVFTLITISHFSPLFYIKAQSPVVSLAEKTARVDALFSKQNWKKKPGLAVLVMKDGRIVYLKGFGLADIENNKPISADMAFDLASITKQFTAVAVLQLTERGKLSLDDSVRKFYPQFPAYADKITVRHLLGHTAGLPDYIELFLKSGRLKADGSPDGFEPTNDDVIKLLAAQKEPSFAAGEKWEYSNSGYAVLAKIVEKASGKPFPKFVAENILKPLKMKQSVVYNETKPKVTNRAKSYQKKGEVYENIDYTPLNLIYGDGSLNTTPNDLVKWDAALYSDKLLKQEVLRQAFQPGKLNNGSATRYGFGWFVKDTDYGLELSHSGGWVGFRNYIVRYPEKRLTVAVLSNSAEINPAANPFKIAQIFLEDKKE